MFIVYKDLLTVQRDRMNGINLRKLFSILVTWTPSMLSKGEKGTSKKLFT